MRHALLRGIACLAAMGLGGAAAAQAWKPAEPVEIVVGAGPGGGNDNTARTLQKLFQEAQLVTVPVNVVNRAGAGGAIALTYLNQHTGKGNYLGLTSNTLLTNHITGRSPLSPAHFTPLAVLINEYLVFSVKPDSPLSSAKDLVAQLKKDPGSIVVGISSSLGNINHIGFATAARAVGVDPRKVKTVAFKSSNESITALLGGHIDLVVGPASIAARFLESRQMRVLAITSPARQPGVYATVPTWKETGVNAVIDNWRGVIGVKGLSAAQVAYWDGAHAKLFGLKEWKQDVATNYWDNAALTSREAARYMDRQYDFLKRTLIDLDMVKAGP